MDLSTAAESALTSLESSADGGMVEEYEVTRHGKRVKRGSAKSQIEAAVMLNALASRQSSGLCKLAKLRGDE